MRTYSLTDNLPDFNMNPPEYDEGPEPDWVEDFCGANPLLSACWEAYDDYCIPFMSGSYDPEYDTLPDFDDFVNEWFENHAEKAIEYYGACQRDAGNDVDINDDYWIGFTDSYAAYLKESWRSKLATVEQYKVSYDSWCKQGGLKHAA